MEDLEAPRPAEQLYSTRLAEAEDHISELERRDGQLASARLVVFAAGLVLAWPAIVTGAIAPWWMLLPGVVFSGLAIRHTQILNDLVRSRHRADFHRRGLARVRAGGYAPLDEGLRFADPEHPYSADLDLFGPDSLFAQLCTARTEPGRSTLAAWLSAPASPDEVRLRQDAVVDLAERSDFREEVDLLGAEIEPEITVDELDAWGRAPIALRGAFVPLVTVTLGVVNLCAVFGWLFASLDRLWLLAALGLSGAFHLVSKRSVTTVLEAAGRPANELRFISDLLARFEREPMSSARLCTLQGTERGPVASSTEVPPSAAIAELARLTEWNDSRRNQLFWPVATLLLLGTQLAYAIERWRARHGEAAGDWLREVGEVEALAALGTFGFENPRYVLPEIVEGEPELLATELAHPLLPERARVANDVQLGGQLQLLLVSGSNMSGKSTLLRTVGTAVVLAFAGAPVCASIFRVTPLTVGASLHVQDSLAAGVSRFYAELRRLARVRELAESGPTLFLLDEILHGTNSHDREIGATEIVSMLLERGAIGLVTTHDLALTRVAADLAPRARNVHFEDHVEAGKMAFDYKLHPGPVERGNALALMRSLGLRPED